VEFRGFSFRNRTGKSSARIDAEIERLFQTCVEQLNVGTTGSGHLIESMLFSLISIRHGE
jgi:hypothetical protein